MESNSIETQYQMFENERRKVAALNALFVELIQHPTNPLTNEDLVKLIARRPEKYGRFAGWIGKLPH